MTPTHQSKGKDWHIRSQDPSFMLLSSNMCSHSQETLPQGKMIGKGFPGKRTQKQTRILMLIPNCAGWFWPQLDTNSSHLRRGNPSWRAASIRLAWEHVCEEFSWLMIDVSGPHPPRAVPPLGRWPGLYKEAGWVEAESEAVCIIPQWSLLQVLPWDLALACLDDGL